MRAELPRGGRRAHAGRVRHCASTEALPARPATFPRHSGLPAERALRALVPPAASPIIVMTPRLHWETDGLDWPHRASSRFVRAGGLRWHVQLMGRGPVLLMLHGTGAASHSWRDLAPVLARDFTVVMPDLPGHGFSDPMPAARLSLPGMAAALRDLTAALALVPDLLVGHSAGAAIAARMCLDGTPARALVSINGAFLPPSGWAGLIFMPAARLLALNPLVPRLVSWRASDARAMARLIGSTGSSLDAAGAALYGKLVRSPAHVAGTLAMMAGWDLRPLLNDLSRLQVPVTLVVGQGDRTVPPAETDVVMRLLPHARRVDLAGLGHLAHEEAPDEVVALVRDALSMSEATDINRVNKT
jgi:magnesium chelatase accessory protein